jgi:transposase-like protein
MTKGEQVRLTAWRLRVLRQAADEGNVARVCRRFGISRKSFYKWKRRHAELHALAVCADAVATLEQVRRARAARQGVSYTPETVQNFIPARRSRHAHGVMGR